MAIAVSLHDCYSLPAKLDTVFTRPALVYGYFYAPDAHNIVTCLSSSTLLWIVLIAAFVVTELGLTAILVHLSTRSLPDRRQG